MRMPSASPNAMSRNCWPPEPRPATTPKTTNVPARISPAEVTVVPVTLTAR